MPGKKRCWASWNYRTDVVGENEKPTTHYWMNSLQGVSEKENYFVSLNAGDRIPEANILQDFDYEHPLFDLDAIAAQKRIPELNDPANGTHTYFCGAWTRYGFHEDGFLSAVNLCETLLGGDPWTLR